MNRKPCPSVLRSEGLIYCTFAEGHSDKHGGSLNGFVVEWTDAEASQLTSQDVHIKRDGDQMQVSRRDLLALDPDQRLKFIDRLVRDAEFE
jgi:hypothetical protein